MNLDQIKPGMRVRVVQQIDRREGSWRTEVEGEVMEIAQAPTGSWYAHAPKHRYCLQRIRLRKDDGEITLLSLDEDSQVFLVGDGQPSGKP